MTDVRRHVECKHCFVSATPRLRGEFSFACLPDTVVPPTEGWNALTTIAATTRIVSRCSAQGVATRVCSLLQCPCRRCRPHRARGNLPGLQRRERFLRAYDMRRARGNLHSGPGDERPEAGHPRCGRGEWRRTAMLALRRLPAGDLRVR